MAAGKPQSMAATNSLRRARILISRFTYRPFRIAFEAVVSISK